MGQPGIGVAQYVLASYTSVTKAAAQSVTSTSVTQSGGITAMEFTIPLAAIAPATKALSPDQLQTHIWAYSAGTNM